MSRRVTVAGLGQGEVDTHLYFWQCCGGLLPNSLSTASPRNTGEVSVLLTPHPDLKGEGNFCHEGISNVLPRLQIHSQHVELSPIPAQTPPHRCAQSQLRSVISGPSLSSHQLQKPGKGTQGAKTRLRAGGSSSPSQQQDGIPVKQPVAPSSARAGSAPIAGQTGQIRAPGSGKGVLDTGRPQGAPPCSCANSYRRTVLQWHRGKKSPGAGNTPSHCSRKSANCCLMAGDGSPIPWREKCLWHTR